MQSDDECDQKRTGAYPEIFLVSSRLGILASTSFTMPGTTKSSSTPSASQHKAKSSSKHHVVTSAKKGLGAPSQHTQGSRKGKRAWRKNVDIGDVEEGLEGLRTEERVTGYVFIAVGRSSEH